MGKQIKVIADTFSDLSRGTLNNVVVKETELIEISRDKEDFSGDLSRWIFPNTGIWTVEDGKLKCVGETQANQAIFDHELDFDKRFTLKVYLQNDKSSTGVWLGGLYCRRYSGSKYQAGGIITSVLPWDSNWRFEYYPNLKTFDWYVGETLVLSGLSVGLDRKNIMLDVDEPAHTQYFDDVEIIYWKAKGSLELAKLHNQFPHSQSFEECSGEHIGDVANPNSVVTDIGGGWGVATHYNTATIRVETDGGYHGNKRLSFIHDGSSGWKGARLGVSITADKWYRVSVRARANRYQDKHWGSGYAFYSTGFTPHFQYDISPFDNPKKWVAGVAVFQAPSSRTGAVYLYGVTDGDSGLVLDYDAIMWEEFDEDPTGKPFGFTIDQGYPIEGGERVSEPVDLSATEISQKALNISQISTPTGTSLNQYSSLDNGLTWQRIVPGKNLNSNIGLKMNGVDNYVRIPNSEALHFYDGEPETVEIKIKPKDKGDNYFLFHHHGWGRRIKWEANSFTFLLSNIDGVNSFTTDPIYPPNQIYNVAYSVDENFLVTYYINHETVGTIQLDNPLRDASSYWFFGSSWAGSSQYFFEGTVYEARIWKACKSEANILANYNKHLTGNEQGLVGYWLFDEGEGDVVKDKVYRGNSFNLDAPISGKAEWELTPIQGDMTGKSLILKQQLYTNDPALTPQLSESRTMVHPANAILVSDEYKSRCKDFENIFEHQLTIHNLTKYSDITEFVELSSFALDASEKGITGLVNANSLNFRIKTDIDKNVSSIVQDGDIIKVTQSFNNETVTTFYGFVNDTPANYKNLEHVYTVNVFDNLRKGFKGKFEENEVKVGWYLCNNFETDKSLAHYLAGLIGFELGNVIFEDITDGVGNHIQVHYAHLEKGVKYITELVTLVKGVQGKLYVNHDNQLVLNSPFNEEDFIDIGHTFDEEIQSEIKVSAIKAKYDSVEVKYDTFMIADRQVCWMLYEKQTYDKANDKANMLIKADSESAWIKIELVTPICINLEGTPEILVEDASGNDMSTFLQYDMELDMTGGKLKLHNLHSQDIYIQKFKIYGEPLEKLSGHEYKYHEVEKPDNPITVSNKYIQNEAMAEMNAKYAFHMQCKDRRQFEFKCYHLPFLALSNKVGLKKRDIDAQCLVSRFSHKVSENHLETSVELIEYLPFEGFAGISTSISASPNVKKDLEEFKVDKIQNDGIFPEGLPVPVPTNVKATGSFKYIWVEWDNVQRKDILGYNVQVDAEGTILKYFTDSNSYMFPGQAGVEYAIQVSAVCLPGESVKSSPAVTATTKRIEEPDIPDELLEESKLSSSLKTKINLAKSQSDDYANQVIAYPTEEDEDNQTTVNYKLKYSAGDIYVGTEVETDPNAFFDLTDQNDNELLDAEGNVVKVVDIRDENWAQLIGSGKATWHGGEGAESVSLVLSTVPANPQMRVSYGVKKMLKELAVDGLLKKGVTAKQIDANLVDALENMKGFAWNETVPAGMKLIDVASRITNNEGTLTSHQSSIAQNATDIQSAVTRVSSTENNIAANQTAIDQNADNIALNASEIQISKDGVAANSANIQLNANGIQQTVTDIESANERINERSIAMPDNAMLFHFDDNLMSTRQVKPLESVATLRPHEGKYGGAVAVEGGTRNLLNTIGDGADQDWTKWSHWNNGTYWGATEQYDDPVWGKVFKGTKDGATLTNTYIYDYYPYSYAVGDVLSFSCWMKVNKNITKTMKLYVISSVGGQHDVAPLDTKTIEFKAGAWQYVTWTSGAVTETVSATGGFGLLMGTSGWEGCIVEVAYPQFEKNPFPTSFVSGTRAAGRSRYKHGLDMSGQYCFGGWIKPNVDVQHLVDKSMERYAYDYRYRAILDLHPSAGGRYDMWWGTEKTFHLGTGVDVGGSTMHVGARMATKDDWVFFVVAGDGYTTKLYVGLDGQINSATRIRTGDVASEEIWLDGYSGAWQGTNLIDEFFIIPNYAPSLETIKTWYESKAPFYDSMQTELQASQVTQLANEFTVKIQQHANGKEVISGFGLATDSEGISEFGVLADRFKIYGTPGDENEGGTPIFIVDAQTKKVYLAGDLIADGMISGRMISTPDLIAKIAAIDEAIIDDAKIANIEADKITTNRAKIKGAQIDEATITDAHITNLHGSKIEAGTITAKEINVGSLNPINKPLDSNLWHFDHNTQSTSGLSPIEAVVSFRPKEGRFNGAVAIEEATTNLDTKGSFEDGSGSSSHWNNSGTSDGGVTTERAYHGKHSYKLEKLTDGNTGWASNYVEVTPNSYYSLSLYVFIEKLAPGESGAPYWREKRTSITNGENKGVLWLYDNRQVTDWFDIPQGRWVRLQKTGLTSSDALNVAVSAYIYKAGTKVYFDAVQLEKKTLATSFTVDTRPKGKLKYLLPFSHKGTISLYLNKRHLSKGIYKDEFMFSIENENNEQLLYFSYLISMDGLVLHQRAGTSLFQQHLLQDWFSTYTKEWFHLGISWTFNLQGGVDYKVFFNGSLKAAFTLDTTSYSIYPNYITFGDDSKKVNIWVDELMHSKNYLPDEIPAWYRSESPFFDSPDSITAGESTWIDEKGITTVDPEGNYSQLTSGRLAFYEAGNPEPWWYTNRVMRGEVEDGTFVEVPWWTSQTKIITSIKNLVTYNPLFPDDLQMYYTEAEHDEVNGVPGYWIYGKAVIPKGNYGPYHINNWVPYGGAHLKTLDSIDQTTKIKFCVEVMTHWNKPVFTACYVDLVRDSDNVVINSKRVQNNQSYRYYYGVFDNLAPGKYYLKYTASADHFVFRWWEYWAYTVVHGAEVPVGDNQEKPMVAYIIIEGGQ